MSETSTSEGNAGVDHTLVKSELEDRAGGGELLEDTDPNSFKPASYDFRAGDHVIVADPEKEQLTERVLKNEGSIVIKSGSAITFRSKEKVNLSSDIKGRLSPKSKLANKKIFYPGGLIDPGYRGYLWFTLFNMGVQDFEIKYEDPIVTGEFVRVQSSDSYGDGKVVEQLAEKYQPRVPSIDDHYTFDWEEINDRLGTTQENREDITELEKEVSRLSDINDELLFGAMAGIVAGIVAGVTLQIMSFLI